ncbi:MAG TPA: DUF167 domain-containing protein [Vicinamibacterales bacterium]|nr:DUF167 domain-containing protein [Vicinamibacterales bacterium]
MTCELAVRVVPRASRAGVTGTRAGAVLVRLASAPVDGAANAELIEILARALDLPRRAVTIVAGAASRLKRIRVEGLTRDQALQKLGLST